MPQRSLENDPLVEKLSQLYWLKFKENGGLEQWFLAWQPSLAWQSCGFVATRRAGKRCDVSLKISFVATRWSENIQMVSKITRLCRFKWEAKSGLLLGSRHYLWYHLELRNTLHITDFHESSIESYSCSSRNMSLFAFRSGFDNVHPHHLQYKSNKAHRNCKQTTHDSKVTVILLGYRLC